MKTVVLKKIINIIFLMSFVAISVIGYALFNRTSNKNKITENKHNSHEFKRFLAEIIDKEAAYRDHYEITRQNRGTALDILKNDEPISADFQMEALQNIKKAQRKLEEFKETAATFQNSSNYNIRKIVKECLIFHKYADVLLNNHYCFILSPDTYISSHENIKILTEFTALHKEQHGHICALIQNVGKIELSKDANMDEGFEFQFSKKEDLAMKRWKNKTMTEMISDAHRGDPAALYMVGFSLKYGAGGYSINTAQANKYFAGAATLGFVPAMNELKSMYLEDHQNPFLALIYINLMASFGHTEFTMAYRDQRRDIVNKFGLETATEIERIATEKTIKIYKTMNEIEQAEDKEKAVINLLFIERGIVGEDTEFGNSYWEKLINKNKVDDMQAYKN